MFHLLTCEHSWLELAWLSDGSTDLKKHTSSQVLTPIICEHSTPNLPKMIPNAINSTGHAGACGVLQALLLRSLNGGSYTVQCALAVSNLQMMSFGKYSEEQIEKIKARNPELVGHMRHYDEIVSHGVNRHVVRGVIADRPFEKAIKKEYYETIDGSPWGWNDVEIVKLGFQLTKTPTNFSFGAHPPGYHLPAWKAEKNPDFEPLPKWNASKDHV